MLCANTEIYDIVEISGGAGLPGTAGDGQLIQITPTPVC
jgi:hypothetical protein